MKPYISNIISVFLFLLTWHGCQNHSDNVESGNLQVPKDFSDFYTLFHTDSTYQMNHILFPLDGHPAADTGKRYDEEFKWQKADWKIHNFDHFDPELYEVTRKVTDSAVVTEFIRDINSGFGIKRRFAKFDSMWYLIYYDAMNPGK